MSTHLFQATPGKTFVQYLDLILHVTPPPLMYSRKNYPHFQYHSITHKEKG